MFCLGSVGEVKGQSLGPGVTSVFVEEDGDLEVIAVDLFFTNNFSWCLGENLLIRNHT